MIRARISNIITIAATALLGLLGLVFAFIEARMLIAGDFAAYAVPWYGVLVAIGRLVAALLWMILLPLLGLLLKVRFFRLGAGIAVFAAGFLYNIFVFQGFSSGGSIVGMVVWGVTILYLLGAVIYPLKESKE